MTVVLYYIFWFFIAWNIYVYLMMPFKRWGVAATASEIAYFIDTYMRGGMKRARLRLRDPSTKKYIDFVKLTSKYTISRFFLEVDSGKLPAADFQMIRNIFDLRGIPYYLTTPLDPQSVKLISYFDMDMDAATHAAKLILYGVFGLEHGSLVRAGCYKGGNLFPDAMGYWDNHPQFQEYLEKYGKPTMERPRIYIPPRENYLNVRNTVTSQENSDCQKGVQQI